MRSGEQQKRRVVDARKKRKAGLWKAAMESLKTAAAGTEPLMPPIIQAVKARATVGEISDALRSVWGVFRPN